MKTIRRLYYKLFPKYEVLETTCVTWAEGDKLIRENHDGPEDKQWHIAKEEDNNHIIGIVWLCRKIRIVE